MRIQIIPSRNVGSVLITSLVTCVVVATVLASYLTMVQTSNIAVTRSQAWNAALPIAEAGVEEAFGQINRSAPFFDPKDATNNLSANGWTCAGNVYQSPRRQLGADYYDVTITLHNMSPRINATGYVWMASSYGHGPSASFASLGTSAGSGPAYQVRAVQVEITLDSLFPMGMAALQVIDLKGFNITTDSFDSADPNYSNNGLYPYGYPNKTKDNGNLSTDFTVVDSLNVGNAKIKGKIQTGPNGTISLGPNGSVGNRAWVEGGTKGIEPGHSDDDFNVAFPDVTLPATTWTGVAAGDHTIDGQSYDYVFLTDGDYQINNPSGSIYVGTNANVRLKVTGTARLTDNNDQIRIAAVNASLKIFMTGAKFTLAGKGLVNESGLANNFYYYGLPSNTEVNFNGNAAFTGAIYAPQADFTMGGGGKDTYDFVGTSVSKTVKMNGHYNFHYDENIRRIGPSRGFVPTKWAEV